MSASPDSLARHTPSTELDGHGSVAADRVATLAQYQVNRLSLLAWIHPSWLSVETFALLQDYAVPGAAGAACAAAWLETENLPLPPLSAFRSRCEALAALPITDALYMLRLRALFFRRGELRYWVDRESRTLLSEWLGLDATIALRGLLGSANGPPVDRLMRRHGMSPLDDLSADELAWEGFCLFEYDGMARPGGPLALLKFALPRALPVPGWISPDNVWTSVNESIAVLKQLPVLYPEQSWLSGYDIQI